MLDEIGIGRQRYVVEHAAKCRRESLRTEPIGKRVRERGNLLLFCRTQQYLQKFGASAFVELICRRGCEQFLSASATKSDMIDVTPIMPSSTGMRFQESNSRFSRVWRESRSRPRKSSHERTWSASNCQAHRRPRAR